MKSKLLLNKNLSCFYGPKFESHVTSGEIHESQLGQRLKVTPLCVELSSKQKPKLPWANLAIEGYKHCEMVIHSYYHILMENLFL